jgi:transposase
MTNATHETLDYLGVDMAKARFQWGVHGTRLTHSATNDAAGFEVLLTDLRQRHVSLIVSEATGGLERALACRLLQEGLPVAVVNPRAAREVARSMGHLAKTDAIDALALAHYAHTLAHKANQTGVRLTPLPAHLELLQAMVLRRRQLIDMRTAESNRRGGAMRVLRQSIDAVIKTLNRQIAALTRTSIRIWTITSRKWTSASRTSSASAPTPAPQSWPSCLSWVRSATRVRQSWPAWPP